MRISVSNADSKRGMLLEFHHESVKGYKRSQICVVIEIIRLTNRQHNWKKPKLEKNQ